MSRWCSVRLGDVLDTTRYGTSKKAKDQPPGLPVIRMGNVTYAGDLDLRDIKYIELDGAEVADQLLEAGDILFNRTNSKELVGKTGLWDGRYPAVAASYFIRLRTKRTRAEPSFVWAVMNTAPMKRRLFETARGAIGQANINTHELCALEIPLPPLDEQRRIIDLLNRAAGIRRLREEALAKARAVIPALFLNIFGDPASNPKGWPILQLGNLVTIEATLELPDIKSEAELPCFGPEAIEAETGATLIRTTVAEALPKSAKFRYMPGDVLYSKIRPYLAKSILAEDIGFISADMYPLRCSRNCDPSYIWQLLLTPAFTNYAISQSMRAQMPKLNRETLFAYQAPCPPLDLQHRFADRLTDLRSIIAQAERALAGARDLERSLMARLLG